MNRIVLIVSLALAVFTSSAQARTHHAHYKHRIHYTPINKTYAVDPGCNIIFLCEGVSVSKRGLKVVKALGIGEAKQVYVQHASSGGEVVGGRPSGCPHAYCGCSASLKVFGRIIPELNLAINWVRKFPATSPAPGMVAARSGHVFVIMSVNSDGTVVAHDGNSGRGLTRIHTVSLHGYHVVNPNG